MSLSTERDGATSAFLPFTATRDSAFKVNPNSPAVSNSRLNMSALYRITLGSAALQVSLQNSRVKPLASHKLSHPLRPRNASAAATKPISTKTVPEMLRKRYVIQERLGQGAFATLIRCIDSYENDKEVAVKIIAKGRTEIGLQELDHSMKLFRRLPSNQMHLISRPHCSFFHGSRLCMVFDLLGDTFEERFNIVSAKAPQTPRRRPSSSSTSCITKDPSGTYACSVEALRWIAFQLSYALFAMHSQGFIHGDLKPTNIMFKRKQTAQCDAKRHGDCACLSADQWNAKLIDLGNVIVPSMLELYTVTAEELLGRASSMLIRRAAAGDDTDGEDHEPVSNGDVRDGVHIASLSYRAPEVLTCLMPFSAALDMWALGTTLIEVRTGHRLFPPSHNMLQVIQSVLGPLPFMTPVSRCMQPPEACVIPSGPYCPSQIITRISELTGIGDSDALGFLSGLLRLDPVTRFSARDALAHSFLRPYTRLLPPEVLAVLRLPVPHADAISPLSSPMLSPVSIRESIASPSVAIRSVASKRSKVPSTAASSPDQKPELPSNSKRPAKRLRC